MTRTPMSPEDYAAIASLMGEYQHLVDSGDEEGWAALFTEDGAFLGLPGAPPDAFRGRERLRQLPRTTAAFGGKFRHFTGSFTCTTAIPPTRPSRATTCWASTG